MPTTIFVWDEISDNVICEMTAANVVTQSYINRPERHGELLSTRRGTTNRYYHYDGMGNTRKLTGDTQNVTDTYIFDGFGNEVFQSGTTTNPFRYKGAVGYYTNAATNDIYVRARTYQPVTGRWLSKDPLGFADGANLFGAYFVPCFSDPSGLDVYVYQSWTHRKICVDIWTVCSPVGAKAGVRCFSFALSVGDIGIRDGVCCPGVVHEAGADTNAWTCVSRKALTCDQDKLFLAEILNHVGHYAPYNIFTRNCRHFVETWFNHVPGHPIAPC